MALSLPIIEEIFHLMRRYGEDNDKQSIRYKEVLQGV